MSNIFLMSRCYVRENFRISHWRPWHLGTQLHSQIVAILQGGAGKAPGDSDNGMPKSRAVQRPTEPGRGGLGSVWGGHPGDGLGSHGSYKTKQQPGFCSSTEDVPRSRRSGLPPSAQQVSAGAWGQRVQERSLGRKQLMWDNSAYVANSAPSSTKSEKVIPSLVFKGWRSTSLPSTGRQPSPLLTASLIVLIPSGVSLERVCLPAELRLANSL